MKTYLINRYQTAVSKGHTFKLKRPLGTIQEGETVHCFAEDKDYLWLYLPRDWHGVREVKLKKTLRDYFLTLCS